MPEDIPVPAAVGQTSEMIPIFKGKRQVSQKQAEGLKKGREALVQMRELKAKRKETGESEPERPVLLPKVKSVPSKSKLGEMKKDMEEMKGMIANFTKPVEIAKPVEIVKPVERILTGSELLDRVFNLNRR